MSYGLKMPWLAAAKALRGVPAEIAPAMGRSARRVAIGAAAALAGCAVGPDYKPPAPLSVERYTSSPLPQRTAAADVPGGQAQTFVLDQDIPAQWWTLFRSDALNQLIRTALDNSPSLEQARARLEQAQEDFNARAGATEYPQVDADLYARRQRINPQALGFQSVPNPGPFALYNATASVSYLLDLFGLNRRELESLASRVDYQRFELEAARLALTANIVTTAVREASLRTQIETTETVVSLQQKELAIIEQRVRIGSAARIDAAAQRVELAQTRASLPPLRSQLDRTRHQLAVYAGLPPSENLPEFRLQDLELPAELPLSVPSVLAQRRPDIRAAEALLHAASADIGVATANLYPQITLSAGGGWQGTHASTLLYGSNEIWNFGATVLQPIFHGGELRAKRRSAVAAYDQAAAAYREVVLQALQNVADALRALEHDAQALQARADAAAQARYTYETASQQYRVGSASYFSLVDAQRQYEQTMMQQVLAQADRYADSAALVQALGGGWWQHATKMDR